MTEHEALLTADDLLNMLGTLAKRYRNRAERLSAKQFSDEVLTLLDGPAATAVAAALSNAHNFHD